MHMDNPPTNAQKFLALYAQELAASMARKPESFGIGTAPDATTIAREAEQRADKMVTAIIRGNAVNVSDTMRRVAKKLGAGTKQADIYAFIRS